MLPRQPKSNAPSQSASKTSKPAAQSTEASPAQPILELQQTIGNAATQRALSSGSDDDENPADEQQNRILALQPMIGNAGVQRMLQRSRSNDATIQRRLTFTSDRLSGKKEQSTFGKVFDNANSSTFRAIEVALASYHQTGVSDNAAQEKFLSIIITKCKEWLGDKEHQKAADAQKRDSINILIGEARTEYHRVIITKELGIPRQTIDKFDVATVEQFWLVVTAFATNDSKAALFLFNRLKPRLGDGADLIEAFMKRNQVAKIDPNLAKSMNNPKFEMNATAAGSADAIKLVKVQAQQKLDRLAKLEADATRLEAFYRADVQDRTTKKEALPDYKDLPPDKKALYDRIEAKQYTPNALKIWRYPLLQAGTPEGTEMAKLKIEKEHYLALISGKATADKKKEKDFDKFTETELYGVMGYTSNLYGAINSPLRFDVGDDTKFTAGHANLAGSITSALSKLKPFKGDVYRHGGDFKGYSSVNIEGAVVSDMAPLSTAIDQKGPASAAEQHEVLEILTSVAGRDVSKMSMFGSKEGEVLFAPGTRFRIVAAFERDKAAWGRDHADGQWQVNNQIHHPMFNKALDAIKRDDRKNDFHRIVIKAEVG